MDHSMITPDTTVCRLEHVLAGSLGDETVTMDVNQGRYYGLNRTACRLWELMSEPVAVRGLCDKLAAEFAVSPEQCERDVLNFVKDLQTRGLVQVVNDAAL